MDGLVVGIVIGVVVGAAIGGAFLWYARRQSLAAAQSMATELSTVAEQLRTAFAALSREALSANTDDFVKLAKATFEQQFTAGEKTLDEKKKLIDARLDELGKRLTTLNEVVQAAEKQRAESHGALQKHLETNAQATRQLQTTTAQLREVLANPQRRGAWGERMAEDVLRLAGFIENVNYFKQRPLDERTRPDFSFPLPGDRWLHMDAKFPLENYLKALDAPDEAGRQSGTAQFLRDVRNQIKDVTTRSYIDPARGTVDYMLVFIPNEQIYAFIHQHDQTLLDDSIRLKVVLCSPLTLYAILAVIRQATDSFRVEQSSHRILELLTEFQKQWGKFVETMGKVGDKLDDARKSYEEMVGTRTRALDRQLDKIEDLRAARAELPEPRSAGN